MPDVTPFQTLLMKQAGQVLSLAGDVTVFEALATVVARAPAIAARLTPPGTAQQVLAALVADPSSVQAAFKAEGLGDQFTTLTQAPAKLATLLPTEYQGLLQTVASLHGKTGASISWSLSGSAAGPANQSYALSFTGSAKLTFNADDSWPGGDGSQLLSVQGAGQVDASGSVTAPFAPGASLKAGVDASADLTLTYYFKPDPNALYAVALAESLPNLADPFDFTSVWDRLKNGNLQGVTLKFDGAISAQVQAILGDAVQLGGGNVADLAATIAVSSKLAGTYTLKVLKTDAGFSVDMTRDPSAQSDLSGSLGLDVDISGLTKSLTQTLTTLTKTWDTALTDIKPFLSPGTWLSQHASQAFSDELKKVVSDAGLQTALVSDFDTALGATPQGGGVGDWLSGVVTSAIDRGSVLVETDANAAIANVMTEITRALPVLAANPLTPALQDAQTQLEGLVTTGVNEVRDQLDTAIKNALAASTANLEAALKKLGATIGPVFKSLDDALAPVREVLAKVDTQFHQLIDPVESALQQKVTAKLTFDDSISTETTAVVDGAFTQANPQTADLYHALTTGSLQAVINIFDGQKAAVGFTLDTVNSSITRLSKRQSSQGLVISFLNLSLSWSLVWSGTGKVFTDGLGNVHVDAQANLAATFASFLSNRSVSFVETASIVAGAAQAATNAPSPTLEIAITATYGSKKLVWTGVDAFVKQLAGQGLVSGDCERHANAQFTQWVGASGSFNGSIAGALDISGPQIPVLLQLTSRNAPDNALDADGQRLIIHASLDYVRQRNPSGTGDFARGKRTYANAVGKALDDEAAVLDAIQFLPGGMPSMENLPTLGITLTDGGGELADYVQFFEDVFLIQQVIDIVDQMGRLYLANPKTWTAEQYSGVEQTIAADSHNWVNLWTPAVDLFGPQVSAWTVTFMRIMSDLAGQAGKPSVMVTLTYTPPTGDPKTAAFG